MGKAGNASGFLVENRARHWAFVFRPFNGRLKSFLAFCWPWFGDGIFVRRYPAGLKIEQLGYI